MDPNAQTLPAQLVNAVLQQSVSPSILTVVRGFAKVFVGEIVEKGESLSHREINGLTPTTSEASVCRLSPNLLCHGHSSPDVGPPGLVDAARSPGSVPDLPTRARRAGGRRVVPPEKALCPLTPCWSFFVSHVANTSHIM